MSKNLQELIDYLEEVKNEIGWDVEKKMGSYCIDDFEDCIFVDHIKGEVSLYQY